MLSLFLNLLTRNVNMFHQSNAPASMDNIPKMDKNKVVSLLINPNRAKSAINTKSISGFEKVSPKDVI